MRIEGANWENWIYPLARSLPARSLRRIVPQDLLIDTLHFTLGRAGGIYRKPYFRAVEKSAQLARLGPNRMDHFLSDHLAFLLRFYLEMVRLVEQPAASIKRQIFSRLDADIAPLREAVKEGRGVLIPIVQLNVFLRLFFANLPQETGFHAIVHKQIPEVQEILNKADPGWEFMFLEHFSTRKIIRAFEAGHVVLCNVDHAYPGTEVTLANVLGHPAIMPSGIFRLAHRMGIPVAPLILTEESGRIRLSAPKTLYWDAFSEDELPVASMLTQVQREFNAAIKRVPEQWLGWGNLLYRWTSWQSVIPERGSYS